MEIFQKLNDNGLTIVLVTHEHDIAQFAKRVLVFRQLFCSVFPYACAAE